MNLENLLNDNSFQYDDRFLKIDDTVYYSKITSDQINKLGYNLESITGEIYNTINDMIDNFSKETAYVKKVCLTNKREVRLRDYFIITINNKRLTDSSKFRCLGYILVAIDDIGKSAEIVMIHIFPGIERRHLGTILLGTAELILNDNYDCNNIYLKTDEEFPGIKEFYANMNYKVIKERDICGWTTYGRNIYSYRELKILAINLMNKQYR